MRILLRLFEVIKGDKEYSYTWQTHVPWSYKFFNEEDLILTSKRLILTSKSPPQRCTVGESWFGNCQQVDGPRWPLCANFDRIVMLWIVIAISIITLLGEMNESIYFFEQLEQCLVTDKHSSSVDYSYYWKGRRSLWVSLLNLPFGSQKSKQSVALETVIIYFIWISALSPKSANLLWYSGCGSIPKHCYLNSHFQTLNLRLIYLFWSNI